MNDSIELDFLLHKIDMEDFDYAVSQYSNWEDIDDKEFHKLRTAYINARWALHDYIYDGRELT